MMVAVLTGATSVRVCVLLSIKHNLPNFIAPSNSTFYMTSFRPSRGHGLFFRPLIDLYRVED